ncbi:hypothetical protein RFI_09191 [Reticulomyxa filosa]|uniref:Uncharacterized protein n=1 Tax=Reticulomyxa filosa TaxID=46433 RepID=X6NRJ5_RETFI|nr:hypothetical protein RFI_09191 [Reticulomyxa filosa]|eukprot:ETO27942.1 hypothetical protein RFI_09191 [Reticulomyxa filosa]
MYGGNQYCGNSDEEGRIVMYGIELSTFNGGRYLCSESGDYTIRLWDVEISKLLRVFNGHTHYVWCVDISPFRSNKDRKKNNKSNNTGIIGGNVGANTILSGSYDKKVRLLDIRSGEQIQMFSGHTKAVTCVECSPFEVNSSCGPNVICSGSNDNTIRFWDIRSNKKELYVVKGGEDKDEGITCLKLVSLEKKQDNYCDFIFLKFGVLFDFFFAAICLLVKKEECSIYFIKNSLNLKVKIFLLNAHLLSCTTFI